MQNSAAVQVIGMIYIFLDTFCNDPRSNWAIVSSRVQLTSLRNNRILGFRVLGLSAFDRWKLTSLDVFGLWMLELSDDRPFMSRFNGDFGVIDFRLKILV